jgi:GH15 family glucan-1,4-alpha-glucosidase
LEETLLNSSPSGGAPRYEHDNYFATDSKYLGNPWFVTTLWMAQYYARNDQLERCHELVDWTIKHALPSGVLSEQVNPSTGDPLSVTPLVWSHAELINTVLDMAKLG